MLVSAPDVGAQALSRLENVKLPVSAGSDQFVVPRNLRHTVLADSCRLRGAGQRLPFRVVSRS